MIESRGRLEWIKHQNNKVHMTKPFFLYFEENIIAGVAVFSFYNLQVGVNEIVGPGVGQPGIYVGNAVGLGVGRRVGAGAYALDHKKALKKSSKYHRNDESIEDLFK